jgi:6-phosphogluconolactonase
VNAETRPILATMTFVLFIEDEAVAGWARERVRAISEKHPSRVLVFDATLPKSEQRVEERARGEWIEAGARDLDAAGLVAALDALALPGTPVVLAWIAEGLSQDSRFPALAEHAQTVICSTSAVTDDASQLRDLIAFVERHPNVDVHDIAYLRLRAWQELVAELFDEPEFASELANVRDVEAECGSDAEMYYLMGWLASRLGWTPCSSDQFCNASGELIRFVLVHEGLPRRLSRVVLETGRLSFVAEIVREDPSVAHLAIRGLPRSAERFVPLRGLDIASLVERAILSSHQDEMFRDALDAVKRILEQRASSASQPARDPGELRVYEGPADVARALADLFADTANRAVLQRGSFSVALAGGTTPKAAYALLGRPPLATTIPWKDVHVFFGDERCVPPDDEDSNYRMARDAFLDAVAIPSANVHRMHGEDDPPVAARAYRKEIVAALGERPRLDLVLLGIGADGHTASLFPGQDPLEDDAALVRAVSDQSHPHPRITLTPAVLNAGRTIVFAVDGAAKAKTLATIRTGEYDPRNHPAQIVAPIDGKLVWLADRAAASI